jgi:3-keto-disaccharide hydrolase
LQSLYEIQVLESNRNKTYPDGQAGAIYCQYPPLVNPARPPGQWQIYDIVFHAPRFDSAKKLTEPALVTLLFNGVLAQDNAMPTGPTDYMKRPPYKYTPAKMPLLLQDHGQPVRYRDIWIRELKETAE